MATSLSSTDINVTWEEVPPIDRNGMITTYEVLYEPLETFEILMSNSVNTTDLSLVLVELHPFVIYSIAIRAYTSIGNGPYSDSLLERTHEDRKQIKLVCAIVYGYLIHLPLFQGPGMPSNVTAVANSSSEIVVFWEEVPAISRNGIILFYEVLFCSAFNCSEVQSLNTTDSTIFTLVLNHLEEFTAYNITVRAYTRVGAGESAPALVVTTLVDGKFVCCKDNTLNLKRV